MKLAISNLLLAINDRLEIGDAENQASSLLLLQIVNRKSLITSEGGQ